MSVPRQWRRLRLIIAPVLLVANFVWVESPSVFATALSTGRGSSAAVEQRVSSLYRVIPTENSGPESNSHASGSEHTIFDDEFSGNMLSSEWIAARGSNPSNDERECYSRQNVSVGGGYLLEKAEVGRACGAYCPPNSASLCPFTSGGIQWSKLSFTYGTVTFRAKFAGAIGSWPAVWLLGSECQTPSWLTSTCNWPAPGSSEIDIAEVLGSNDHRINEQLHTEDSLGNAQIPKCEPLVSAANLNWHTYSLIWTAQSLTWTIDGVQTCQMTAFIPSTPMFLIVNTAVGGVGAGRVVASQFPQTTQVDYIRVTQPTTLGGS